MTTVPGEEGQGLSPRNLVFLERCRKTGLWDVQGALRTDGIVDRAGRGEKI